MIASSDGITFNDVTLNGVAYELDDEFLSSSHIKVELNDVTDNLNPVLLGSELLNKTEIPGYSNDYIINFTESLIDGNYRIIITDHAGNEVKGSDEEHLFTIDVTNPVMTDLSLNEGLDLGVSSTDLKTTVRTPNFTFNSEAGLKSILSRMLKIVMEQLLKRYWLKTQILLLVTSADELSGIATYSVSFIQNFPTKSRAIFILILKIKLAIEI